MAGTVLGATQILSEIQIKNNPDFIALDSDRVRGGSLSVADLTARDAVPADWRKEGATRCWVISESKHYILVGGIENANWQQESAAGESYEYTALTTPTGAAPTVTIDCASANIVSKNLGLDDTSTGDVTLAVSNAVNGTTGTLIITNSDAISRNVLLPASSAHIDFSGNAKTIAIAAAKRAVLGFTFNGSVYAWTGSVEA